jgi:heme exporter protein D
MEISFTREMLIYSVFRWLKGGMELFLCLLVLNLAQSIRQKGIFWNSILRYPSRTRRIRETLAG